jgi:ABC-type multidrug transport system fused ATPase/permease subunit
MDRPAGASGILYLYRQLWTLTEGRHLELVVAVLLLAASQCILLLVPYLAGRAINALQSFGTAGFASAGAWLAGIVAITAGTWLLHGPGRILERNVALEVRRRISLGLIDKLVTVPMAWHESNHSGATAHRILQSSTSMSTFAQNQYLYLSSAIRLVGPVLALFLIEPLIGLAAVIGFCTIILSVIAFNRAMIRLAHAENAAERRFSATLVDLLGNAVTLFALRQARPGRRMLSERLEASFVPLKRAITLNEIKWCVLDVSSKTLACGLVALFAWLVLARSGAQQTLLLGSLYMVWEYSRHAGEVISLFASNFHTFARQQADYSSADVIRDAVPQFGSSTRTEPQAWRSLEIRNLGFRHVAARGNAAGLEDVQLRLERGRRYALIGTSGAGKSTLLRVLAGLSQADRITFRLDDGPALESAPEAALHLRSMSTLVPQDAEVFEGTLAENLGLCESLRGEPSREDYAAAVRIARVDEFIDPEILGLEAPISERAANWSGGQRTRVALARAVLAARGSSLLLLDEPTANLDPTIEASVLDNLFASFSDACIVSSVHRFNLLSRFDEVLLMSGGKIVAQGSAQSLGNSSSEFRELVAAFHREAAAR